MSSSFYQDNPSDHPAGNGRQQVSVHGAACQTESGGKGGRVMNCTGKRCIMQHDIVDPATCQCVSFCPQATPPIMLFYTDRLEIERAFNEWADENGVVKVPNSLVAFLEINGLLNTEKTVKWCRARRQKKQTEEGE